MPGMPPTSRPGPAWPRSPQRTLALATLLVAVSAALPSRPALAQSVALTGVLGSKALLVVNGLPPKAVGSGENYQGVTLVSVGRDEAVIEVARQRQTLHLGDAPVRSGSSQPHGGSGSTVVLTADGRGHFKSNGTINGQQMNFVVDTGATLVSISRADADRMGIAYQNGRPLIMGTANGQTQGWGLKLNSVRVGDVEVYGVDAVVTPTPMPYVLLGNSFLDHFQMHKVNDQMVLEKKP